MSLSGGERRRLEIARGLVSNPKIILLDEPFTGIDPVTIDSIQKIIRSLRNDGIAILITDHQVRETLQITDRSYVIRAGRVLCHGRPDEVLQQPRSPQILLRRGDRPWPSRAAGAASCRAGRAERSTRHLASRRAGEPAAASVSEVFVMRFQIFSAAWLMLSVVATGLCPAAVSARQWMTRPPTTLSKTGTQAVTLTGTVQSASPTLIEMVVDPASKSAVNKAALQGTWTITPQPGAKFQVTGETTRDFLRIGQLVQFKGSLGPNGQVKGKIDRLTVEVVSPKSLHEAATAEAAAAKPKAKDQAKATDESPKVALAGRLIAGRENSWTVRLDSRELRIHLADKAKIMVVMDHFRHVAAGDRITVRGVMLLGKPGVCMADDVKVTLAKPLPAPRRTGKSPKPEVKPILPGEEGNWSKSPT